MKTTSNHTKSAANRGPRARKNDLIVKEMPDEVLVYDLIRDKAHCLNHTAALIWNYCDGRTSVPRIAGRLEKELNTTVDERVVWLALNHLSKNHLLEESVVPPAFMMGINRREMIRALGVAAVVAVPVVTSIVAPMPAQAQSCLPAGATCDPPNTPPCCGSCDGICFGP